VLAAAGILVGTLVGAGPAAAAGGGTLRLSPDRGRPTAPFTITYEYTPTGTTCKGQVTFAWDGSPLHTAAPVGPAMSGRTLRCRAVLATAPPAEDRAPGPHKVAVDTGGLPAAGQVTYTVLPGPTFSALPSPTPSRTTAAPTRQPTTTATANGDNAIAGGIDTSQAAVAPLDTGVPSVAAAASGSSGGGGLVSWILIFGGLLVLGGVTIFGLLIYWTRRGGLGGVEADTQVIGE
jgi:hypothetical protein